MYMYIFHVFKVATMCIVIHVRNRLNKFGNMPYNNYLMT